ncbi:MAG: hypothetical protein AAFY80_06975 [Pseudomonadota bacterium]
MDRIRDRIVDVFLEDVTIRTQWIGQDDEGHVLGEPFVDFYKVILTCRTRKGRLTVLMEPTTFGKTGPRRRERHLELLLHLLDDWPKGMDQLEWMGRLRGMFLKLQCDVQQASRHEWIAFPKKGKVIDGWHVPTDLELAAACEAELGV